MSKSLVTVVIPIITERPTALELISLDQTLQVLGKYPITFMARAELDTTWYEDYCRGKATVYIERFAWSGYKTFVGLMMSSLFYKRFQAYEYMLICHLDAFVFRDELEYWCQQGYDYTGAVVYNPDFWRKPTLLKRLTGFTNPEYYANGGFCLKKVSSFQRLTSKFKYYIALHELLGQLRGAIGFYDDLFVTQHFPKLSSNFRMPPKALAEKFGADYMTTAELDLPFTNRDNTTLPFGVHGWIQRNIEFWAPCIRRYGHDLQIPAEVAAPPAAAAVA